MPPKPSIALLLACIGLAVSGCNPFEAEYISICETELMDRLKSPSGYKRIKVTQHTSKMTSDEWLAHREARGYPAASSIEMDGLKNGTIRPLKNQAFIEYDAPNSFGTLIRGTASCEYVSREGSSLSPSTLDVLINGETNHERIMKAVKRGLTD